MKMEDRNAANLNQISRFFGSYYISYRLNQVLTNEKILNEKFEFYSTIIGDTKQPDDLAGEATIAQEITHGLLFQTIGYCIQYIEDLFALLEAGKNKNLFIKNITTYDAGKIKNFIESKINSEKVRELFYFPYPPDNDFQKNDGLNRLLECMLEFQKFYKENNFFYIQYKHGLTLALRPLRIFTPEQIEQCKNNQLNPILAAFDNKNIEFTLKDQTRINTVILDTQGETGAITPLLMKENNIIRYVFPGDITISDLVKLAYKIRDCIMVFRENLMASVDYDNKIKSFKICLPSPETGKHYYWTHIEEE